MAILIEVVVDVGVDRDTRTFGFHLGLRPFENTLKDQNSSFAIMREVTSPSRSRTDIRNSLVRHKARDFDA